MFRTSLVGAVGTGRFSYAQAGGGVLSSGCQAQAVMLRQRTAVGRGMPDSGVNVERISTPGETAVMAGARMNVIGMFGFPSNVPTVWKLPSCRP